MGIQRFSHLDIPTKYYDYLTDITILIKTGRFVGTIVDVDHWFLPGQHWFFNTSRFVCECPVLLDTTPNNGHERTGADVAAEAIVAVATGSSTNMHELERRRLFVPGLLYHIRRHKIRKEDRVTVPARPGDEISKFRHTISKGTDMASRFDRIILSSTVLSDHSCYKYEEGLLDALKILRPKSSWANPLDIRTSISYLALSKWPCKLDM